MKPSASVFNVLGHHLDFSKTKTELFNFLSPLLLFFSFPLSFLPSYFHSSVKHWSSYSFWWCLFLGLPIGSCTLDISRSFCFLLHSFPFLLTQPKFLSKTAFFPVLTGLTFFFFLCNLQPFSPKYTRTAFLALIPPKALISASATHTSWLKCLPVHFSENAGEG